MIPKFSIRSTCIFFAAKRHAELQPYSISFDAEFTGQKRVAEHMRIDPDGADLERTFGNQVAILVKMAKLAGNFLLR
ncbi:hypothetical protein [Ruegeria arenilitoris]|uniref:hypothetical protein n=1 Tax=Ruegeria arenilitoris TaxID=1173585 RepID=UPI00147C8372|nr:hypothetical protein [Ruegeria arenilitoris]